MTKQTYDHGTPSVLPEDHEMQGVVRMLNKALVFRLDLMGEVRRGARSSRRPEDSDLLVVTRFDDPTGDDEYAGAPIMELLGQLESAVVDNECDKFIAPAVGDVIAGLRKVAAESARIADVLQKLLDEDHFPPTDEIFVRTVGDDGEKA
jgi:hypothetical protein